MQLVGTEALNALLGKASNLCLVNKLTTAGVEFVVIGGTALAYHGLRDVADVDDLDLFLEANITNANGIKSVLESRLYQFSSDKLMNPGTKVPLKDMHFYAELLLATSDINIDDILDSAATVTVSGSAIRVASILHLLEMKQKAVIECTEQLVKHERDLAAIKHHLKITT